MDYQRIYNNLTAKDMIADYTEKHHIIPDCFFITRNRKGPKGWLEGNPNDHSNIVRLTPEAHYLAHLLLVKIYPEHAGLVFAVHRMTSGKYRNNKMYGWIRRKYSEALKNRIISDETRDKIRIASTGNTNMLGKSHSTESRAKMSASRLGNPSPIKGITRSEETKRKISEAHKGKPLSDSQKLSLSIARKGNTNMLGKSHSAETRAKIRAASKGRILSDIARAKISTAQLGNTHRLGKPNSDETRAKMSVSQQSIPKVTCPHCDKVGGVQAMYRWHFDNCKQKPHI